MATLTILQGPPASGKSTIARQMQAESPKDTVIVCRDSLRRARGVYWIPEQEKFIDQLEYFMAEKALEMGYNVIIDATNLNPYTIRKWDVLATKQQAEISYIKLEVSLDECLKRNNNPDRDHEVPEETIRHFFKKYNLCTTTN